MFICLKHAIPIHHEEFFCPICSEVFDIKEEATDFTFWDGYRKGYADGYANGHADGYANGHFEGYNKSVKNIKIQKE
jgi:hypothetical protein